MCGLLNVATTAIVSVFQRCLTDADRGQRNYSLWTSAANTHAFKSFAVASLASKMPVYCAEDTDGVSQSTVLESLQPQTPSTDAWLYSLCKRKEKNEGFTKGLLGEGSNGDQHGSDVEAVVQPTCKLSRQGLINIVR